MGEATQAASLTLAQRAVLVAASASGLGDSYCSMAWGKRLADATNPEIAAAVLGGDVEALGPEERALARWARLMATDPNAVVEEDVQSLRDLGFEDAQILALSIYVGLRLAFSTVNDALGVAPLAVLPAVRSGGLGDRRRPHDHLASCNQMRKVYPTNFGGIRTSGDLAVAVVRNPQCQAVVGQLGRREE